MGRKLTAKGLEKKFHKAIRERDAAIDPLCRICRKNRIECCYHIIAAHYGNALRWDPDNAVGACLACNEKEHYYRDEYHEIHKNLFGEKFERLWQKRHKILKLSKADKLAIIAQVQCCDGNNPECVSHFRGNDPIGKIKANLGQ